MIPLAFLAVCALLWAVAWWHDEVWVPSRLSLRHRACLASIDRLERALFPEWFPSTTSNYTQRVETYEFAPGARWTVDAPNKITWLDDESEDALNGTEGLG